LAASFKNRICIVFDDEKGEFAAMRYLRWFYGKMYKIPLSEVKLKDFAELKLEENGTFTYSTIFILAATIEDGFMSKIQEANGKIPLVLFHDAVYPIYDDIGTRPIFNIKPLSRVEEYVRNVKVEDKLFGSEVYYPATTDTNQHDTSEDKDDFILVEPLEQKNETRPLLSLNSKPVATVCKGNVYIGQRGILVPREDLHLEFNRPVYYLRILDNLLKTLPTGYVRFKLPNWPVGFRIDDLPLTTEQLSSRTKTMDYRYLSSLLELFKAHDATLTCAVVPAYVDVEGKITSWDDIAVDKVQRILSVLREFLKIGTVEIAYHGLTHVTPGYESWTKAGIRQLIGKIMVIGRIMGKRPILYPEFYDVNNRKEIPYEVQYKKISEARKIIKKSFMVSPKVFVPPAHYWDSNTENVLAKLHIPYISCDMNFYSYEAGSVYRKNPCPMGDRGYANNTLLCVSTLLTGSAGSFEESLKVFNELGIPLIWSSHNYKIQLTYDYVVKLFSLIDKYTDKKYMSLSELGDNLLGFEESVLDATINEHIIKCIINAKIPLRVEWHCPQSRTLEIFVDNSRIEAPDQIIVVPQGRHEISIIVESGRKSHPQ